MLLINFLLGNLEIMISSSHSPPLACASISVSLLTCCAFVHNEADSISFSNNALYDFLDKKTARGRLPRQLACARLFGVCLQKLHKARRVYTRATKKSSAFPLERCRSVSRGVRGLFGSTGALLWNLRCSRLGRRFRLGFR